MGPKGPFTGWAQKELIKAWGPKGSFKGWGPKEPSKGWGPKSLFEGWGPERGEEYGEALVGWCICGMVSGVIARAGYRVRIEGKFFRLADEKFVVRGVTYGPFAPPEDGREGEALRLRRWQADVALMASMGFNVVRVYETPSRAFVGLCRDVGLRVLISIPWAHHVDFFEEAGVREAGLEAVRNAVREHHGAAGVFAYLVGNEIEATLARWMGPQRVRSFLEELIEAGREIDRDALFAYSNYPSTEYLSPRNEDFAAFNVFLEDEDALRRYLMRLHHVAGDRPLVLTEFGLDTRAHGEAAQAETFDWFWREADFVF